MILDLILTMRDMQINSNLHKLIKFGNSSKALCLKISSHGISVTVFDHKN